VVTLDATSDSGLCVPRRLHIAFVTERFGQRFGGAEAYGVCLMQELAQHHDITVIAHDYDADCPLRLPWRSISLPRGLPSWMRTLWFAIRAHRATRQGFDLVHSHVNGWCGDIEVMHVSPVRFNWRVRKLPWFKRALSRASPRVQAYLALEAVRVTPRRAHRVVAVSDLTAQQLRQAYGQERDFPVIAPGVAPPAQQAPQWRTTIRQQLGVSDTDMVCLMVARDPLRKGLPTVLQALCQLPDDIHFVLVGCNADLRAWFAHTPHANALQHRVRLLDAAANVHPYYAAADCCLHPTLNDSFGMVPLEAMSHGLPVILSPMPWCGFAQYVCAGQDALVLDHPENTQQLADVIMQLRTQPEIRQKLSQHASTFAQAHSWTRVAQHYQTLYAQVLAERNGLQP